MTKCFGSTQHNAFCSAIIHLQGCVRWNQCKKCGESGMVALGEGNGGRMPSTRGVLDTPRRIRNSSKRHSMNARAYPISASSFFTEKRAPPTFTRKPNDSHKPSFVLWASDREVVCLTKCCLVFSKLQKNEAMMNKKHTVSTRAGVLAREITRD